MKITRPKNEKKIKMQTVSISGFCWNLSADLREVPLQTTTMMATETTTKATTGKTVSNPTTEMSTATPEATTKGGWIWTVH